MRELLLVFIVALIIGSIINGWPKQETQPPAHGSAASTSSVATGLQASTAQQGSSAQQTPSSQPDTSMLPHRDFPDFNSFPSLNQDNFDNIVLASQKPVFIVCYSPNSLSFERMLPLIAAMAQEHGDSILVTRLNVLENAALSRKYEIFSVPTYLVFSKGQLTTKWTGVVAKDRLEAMIATAKP